MILEGDGVATDLALVRVGLLASKESGWSRVMGQCVPLSVLQKQAPKPDGVASDRDPVGHHYRMGLCVGRRQGAIRTIFTTVR